MLLLGDRLLNYFIRQMRYCSSHDKGDFFKWENYLGQQCHQPIWSQTLPAAVWLRLQVINGFGVNRFELDDVLSCWVTLSPIQSALKLADVKKTELREHRAAIKLQRAKAKVVATVTSLRELGVEPTYLSITDYWLKDDQSDHEAKENIRKLKKILGEHLTDLSWALK